MSRPVLFVIDDDAGVVHALRSDLSRRFSQDFTVLGESSAAAGLAALRALAEQDAPVALLIVDHHMSEMPGLEFLARAHDLHPSAKRVLTRRACEQAWIVRCAPGVLAAHRRPGRSRRRAHRAPGRSIKRAASAVDDGATAVRIAHEYLAGGDG
jgi:CheY-like chemotaxis protein